MHIHAFKCWATLHPTHRYEPNRGRIRSWRQTRVRTTAYGMRVFRLWFNFACYQMSDYFALLPQASHSFGYQDQHLHLPPPLNSSFSQASDSNIGFYFPRLSRHSFMYISKPTYLPLRRQAESTLFSDLTTLHSHIRQKEMHDGERRDVVEAE